MNLHLAVLCGLFSNVLLPSHAARILGIVPTPSYSHQVAFHPLWRELSLRGHQLTVLTTDPISDSSLTNLTEIDLHFSYKFWNTIDFNEMAKGSPIKVFSKVTQLTEKLMADQVLHPAVQEILNNKAESFDLVMVEGLFLFMEAFAERFKCPLIQIYSLDALDYTYRNLRNPTHPVLHPDVMLPFYGRLSFFERLISTLYAAAMTYFHDFYILPKRDKQIHKCFGENYPPLKDIISNVSLVFVNADTLLHPIKPLLPTVIQIGGGLHLKPPKPLPEKWKNILDNSSGGVIYFSLGNIIKSNRLNKKKVKVLLETFAELPYTVLWKFESKFSLAVPNNVHISKWFPQQDILRHPNIKLFITQGGLQSLEEAIYNHIPVVGIPFIGDQTRNVKNIVAKGLGVWVNFAAVSKESFKATILEVINNPKYRNKVKELAELALDQPMTGLQRAVWWTEYVIRHKGAKHLRNPAVDLPLYQYYHLDVILFCLTVILILSYIAIKIIKLIARLLWRLTTKIKLKEQ